PATSAPATSATATPVTLGVAGVGGYAGVITDLILANEQTTDPRVRLAGVCDPNPGAFPDRVAALRGKGVQVFDSFDALLAVDAIDAVWLPIPIDLHRPFTEQALAAGKAVMVEKPAAGTVDELDAMIAARDAAGLPVAVGFQDQYRLATLVVKQRLLDGVLGPIRRASVVGLGPRTDTYFKRSAWAGRIRHNGRYVLDSPAQNAMAHFINLPLFLLGPSLHEHAHPVDVEAELYRAAAIENYDTISGRVTLEEGPALLILMTHACEQTSHPAIRIQGERGELTWSPINGPAILTTPDGREVIGADEGAPEASRRMLQRFARLVRGVDEPEVAVATLESARRHTVVINGISEAAPIIAAPPEAVAQVAGRGGTVAAIKGIEQAFERCAARHALLHEAGGLGFTPRAGRRSLVGYSHFAGPAGG
ncbi:MAG: Gfo/Idh/MocA family oxidoreductase, partial [Phycisphaeraceae bacterium]